LTRHLLRGPASTCVLALAVLLPARPGSGADEPSASATPRSASRARPPLRERLLFPLGVTRQGPAARRSAQAVPLLRFREEIQVEAPPLDLERLRVLWWKHWNLPGKPGSSFGTPTHADMLDRSDELSRLSGMPLPPNVSLLPIAVAAGQALVKKLKHEKMPPADPGPPYVEPFVPLEPPPESTPNTSPHAPATGGADGRPPPDASHGQEPAAAGTPK
jgi:hypothetical protein